MSDILDQAAVSHLDSLNEAYDFVAAKLPD